jgi:murein DD-endopeptidase MepM/ murein hydrolase activator NlpD
MRRFEYINPRKRFSDMKSLALSKKSIISAIATTALLTGYLLPENLLIPVKGATEQDWNHDTFWHTPWGKSKVHKGIDIFSSIGTPAVASTYGVVLFAGQLNLGGNVVVVLGPKWRIHYYAHLQNIYTTIGKMIAKSQSIGTVGDSGNAKGKPPHLHYTILSVVPYLWRWDNSPQGWKKMFFLNPSERLTAP